MSQASAIINKVNNVLTRLNVTDRVVYKRITSRSGGDALLGRGVTATNTDTILNPQPAVQVASANYPLIVAGQALAQTAEYLATVSVSAMDRDDVLNENLSIVFVDSHNNQEELFIVGFSPAVLGGQDIAFDLILSSKKR